MIRRTFLLWVLSMSAACASLSAPSGPLAKYAGTYRGVSPTDASPSAYGEIEMVISGHDANVRMATGGGIDAATWSSLRAMTKEEVRLLFKKGSNGDASAATTSGLIGADGFPRIVFLDPTKGAPSIVIKLGEMSEALGPTILCTPHEVDAGKFDEIIAEIDGRVGKNSVPLLKHDGRVVR